MSASTERDAGLQRLAAFAFELGVALGASATVETGVSGPYTSVSLRPRREDALGLLWLAATDEVVLCVGSGRWELEPTAQDLHVLEALVHAVVAGRVAETRGRGWSQVDVTLADGEVRTSRVYQGLGGLLRGLGRRQSDVQRFGPYR